MTTDQKIIKNRLGLSEFRREYIPLPENRKGRSHYG